MSADAIPDSRSPSGSSQRRAPLRLETVTAAMGRGFFAARGWLLWLLLLLSLAVLGASCWSWLVKERENAAIDELIAGQDVAVDPQRASAKLLFARAYYLIERDRLDEVQPMVDQSVWWTDQPARLDLLYDMANARVRRSFEAIAKSDFDNAASLITLAKDAYQEILKLDPEAWNSKYNLDVAARLVRDLPTNWAARELQKPTKQKLWTDLPGVPEGEP